MLEHIQVATAAISRPLSVSNLGVVFDCHLTLGIHIQKICPTAYYHLRNISSIRKVLTGDSVVDLVHDCVVALVHFVLSCRLDYSNSLIQGTIA